MHPTVLIVDDHDDFRASASALLEAEGFAVLGEATDGGAAIVESERLRPDVVLLDIQLPDVDAFTVAERLAAAREPSAVVLISCREAEAYGPRLDAAAAQGFISKRELSGAALTGEEVAVGELTRVGEERPRGRARRRQPGHDLDGDLVLG